MDQSLDDIPNFTIEQLLDLDIPSKPKQSTNHNDYSDDMFGSDDDLLQALEHDPSWRIANEPDYDQPTQTQAYIEIETTEILDSLDNSVENIDDYMSNLDIIKNSSQSITEQEITPFIWEDASMDDASTDLCSQELRSLYLTEEPAISVTPLPQLETSVSSTVTRSSSITIQSSRSGSYLRKRNAIQLRPFTLEDAHFKKSFEGVATKSKLKNTVNTKQTPDDKDTDTDTDFTPFDTQLVDEPTYEISTHELESLGVYRNKPKADKKLQKKNSLIPSAPKTISSPSSRAQKNNKPVEPPFHAQENLASTSTSVASSSSSIPERMHPPLTESFSNNATSTAYPEDLQKYGLDKLVLPHYNKFKTKKIITFTTKRKSSKRKERSTLSRNAELPNSDIFAFDPNPKAIQRPLHTIDSSIPVDDPENESDEEVVFRRPRLKKRKMLISDSEEEDDEEEEEEEVEPMTEEQLDSIFAFPIEPPEPQQVKRYGFKTGSSSSISSSIGSSSIIPIIDDGFEYRDQKKQNMDIRELQAKSLKNVLPASYIKLNQKKLEEEFINRRLAKNTRSHATSSAAVPKKDSSRIPRNTEDIFAAFREDTDDEADNNNVIDRRIQGSNVDTRNRDDTIRIDNNESFYYEDDDDGFVFDYGIDINDNGSMIDYSDSINYDRDAITDRGETVNYGSENMFGIDDGMGYDYDDSDDNDGIVYENTISHNGIIDHADRVDNRSRIDRYFIPEYRNSASTSPITRINTDTSNRTSQNASIPDTSVDQSQAMEFNRISRQGIPSAGNKRTIQLTGTSRRPIAKSSATNARPANRSTGRAKPTGTATTKRKRRPRKAMDDIYVHKPYFLSPMFNSSDRANEAGNQGSGYSRVNKTRENHRASNVNNNENVFHRDDLPRKAFDDIYMNTKRQSKYYTCNDIYIGNYDISDYLNRNVVHKDSTNRIVPIYSLDEVIKRVRDFKNPDLRGIIGLQNTVYIHQQLIVQLISKNLNEKCAYPQFKESHSDLILFGKRYYWKQINSEGTHIIRDFFAKVLQDILHFCRNDEYRPVVDEFGDLPDHEYFYVFVSLCLTQWIPMFPVKEQNELILFLTYHVRSLAYSLTKLVEIRHHEKIGWKPIVKLLLYLLDWTCRLELLHMDRKIWSVIEFSQIMMDVLVYIGYERVKKENNQYLIEAWICLILIMSVSNRKHGYHLNEAIFLNQMTSSIQRKSRELTSYEYKKRRTIKLWAETLDYILNKHTIF